MHLWFTLRLRKTQHFPAYKLAELNRHLFGAQLFQWNSRTALLVRAKLPIPSVCSGNGRAVVYICLYISVYSKTFPSETLCRVTSPSTNKYKPARSHNEVLGGECGHKGERQKLLTSFFKPNQSTKEIRGC